jgi:hypothetical protein
MAGELANWITGKKRHGSARYEERRGDWAWQMKW